MTADRDQDLNLFFTTRSNSFATPDEQWLAFARTEAKKLAAVITDLGDGLSLLDTLLLVARERKAFATAQSHIATTGENDFGDLRSGVYDRSLRESASHHSRIGELRKKLTAGDVHLESQMSTAFTLFKKDGDFFLPVVRNLERASRTGDQVGYLPELDASADALVNTVVGQRLTIEPAHFFEVAKYESVFFKGESGESLTSFYMVRNAEPQFVLIEHPTPPVAAAAVKGSLNTRYGDLLGARNDEVFLGGLSRLMWGLFQAMPFERGSASITTIFTAGLLLSRSMLPRAFNGTRLDIDAISLSPGLFEEAFLESY